MILSNSKSELFYRGEIYRVGDTVIANAESIFAGLAGVICEIRTGEDKETENDTPELLCCFDLPVKASDVAELEKRYSDFCKERKTVEDIPIDSVIMSPEMLILPHSAKNNESIYVLTEEWVNDGDGGVNTFVFTDELTAKAFMNMMLSNEMTHGLIDKWEDSKDFRSEEESLLYEAWIDGYYSELHYSLKIAEEKMIVSPEFVNSFGKRYLEECRYEDFCFQVSEWEETETLNEEEWQRFISDARIPEEINAGLSDTYQSEYWDAVCEAAHKLLNEYLEKHSEETK